MPSRSGVIGAHPRGYLLTLALAILVALAGCGAGPQPATGAAGAQTGASDFGRCWSSHDKSDRARAAVLVTRPSPADPSSVLYLVNPSTGQTLCHQRLEGVVLIDPDSHRPRDVFDTSWRYVVLGPAEYPFPWHLAWSQITVLDLDTGKRISPSPPITVDPTRVRWAAFPPGQRRLWIKPAGGDMVSVDPATGRAVPVDPVAAANADQDQRWPRFDSRGKIVGSYTRYLTVRSLGQRYTLAVNEADAVDQVLADSGAQFSPRLDNRATGCYIDEHGALWHIDRLVPDTFDRTRYGAARFPAWARCATVGNDILVWRAARDTGDGPTTVARVSRDGTITNLPAWPADGDIAN